MPESFTWSIKRVSDSRVNIGQDLVKSLPWIVGSETIEAWVLTLEAGRYRVIPNSEFPKSAVFAQILNAMTPTSSGNPETALDPYLAVLPSRLVPVTISPPGSLWRLNLSNVPLIDATGEEIKALITLLSEGYLELWSPLRFAQAQNIPLHQLLR